MPDWIETWWPVIIGVGGAAWGVFTYFDKRRIEKRKAAEPPVKAGNTVSTSGGSVAAGGEMRGNTISTNRPPDDPVA